MHRTHGRCRIFAHNINWLTGNTVLREALGAQYSYSRSSQDLA
jgi:hypothetical protein